MYFDGFCSFGNLCGWKVICDAYMGTIKSEFKLAGCHRSPYKTRGSHRRADRLGLSTVCDIGPREIQQIQRRGRKTSPRLHRRSRGNENRWIPVGMCVQVCVCVCVYVCVYVCVTAGLVGISGVCRKRDSPTNWNVSATDLENVNKFLSK